MLQRSRRDEYLVSVDPMGGFENVVSNRVANALLGIPPNHHAALAATARQELPT